VLERTLHEAGVFHFAQIAAWGPEDVAWFEQNLEEFKGRVEREGWVEQARILLNGGQTEFSRRVDRGEVDTSRET
jgi:NADH-quinone oxidoreductase subunit E